METRHNWCESNGHVRMPAHPIGVAADPLLVDDIKFLVGTARARCRGWADEVLECRDSAILLFGFAGAYRRSELSEMVCGDVTVHRHHGLHIRLRKSKTDQEGRSIDRPRVSPLTRQMPAPTTPT